MLFRLTAAQTYRRRRRSSNETASWQYKYFEVQVIARMKTRARPRKNRATLSVVPSLLSGLSERPAHLTILALPSSWRSWRIA